MTLPNHHMNRRQWLRTGALLTGGLTLIPSAWGRPPAAPVMPGSYNSCETDALIVRHAPPELKARLFANENPFGPGDKAKKAIEGALSHSHQYSFQFTRQLSKKIGEKEGIKESQLILGAGSTPLLLAAAIHFSRNGGTIISGDPSYDDLPEKARRLNATWIKVPLTADYKLDLDAMEKKIDSKTALVYICNPNNPTATAVDPARLRAFCERVAPKVPVFIDEAYIDYLDDPAAHTMMDCVKKDLPVIIARTFSKLHGFAGLRVGYGMGHPDLISKLSLHTIGEMGISGPSASAALVSYEDTAYLQNALNQTRASKGFLYEVLKEEGYDFIPSVANFVLFPLQMDSRRFTDEMMKRGVGIRGWKVSGKDWCRVSIGRMDEMQAFAEAFRQLS